MCHRKNSSQVCQHHNDNDHDQFCGKFVLLNELSNFYVAHRAPGVQKLKNMDPKDFPQFLTLASEYALV